MRALVVVLAILTIRHAADACSCVPRTFAQYAKAAPTIIVARAGKPEKTGDALKQTFTVLATLKGTPATTFAYTRAATPPCKQDFAEGEVAVIFGSQLDPCNGTVPLAAQLPDFASIVTAAGAKRGTAPLEAIEVALTDALAKYLHDRPAITVATTAAPGKSLQIGKSKLTFTPNPKKRDLELAAFTVGDLAFVSGTYKTEGVRYSVLLQAGKTWKVVGSSVAEK